MKRIAAALIAIVVTGCGCGSAAQGAPPTVTVAHACKSDQDRCLAAGMDAYISKPGNPQELIEMVERIGECESG
jgi:CheY-like chemotaxis protein